MVYFVQRADGLIKIGYSSDVQRRVSELRFEHGPLIMLLTLYGSPLTEKAHHAHFAALRDHGEWFRPGDDLLAYVASLPSQEQRGTVRYLTSGNRRTRADVRSREWPRHHR